MKNIVIILILLTGFYPEQNLKAQIVYTINDSLIFEKYMEALSGYKKPMSQVMVKTAKYFLGEPYVASTLDKSEPERLRINLQEFDCTTFVESCIALTETIFSKNQNFDVFCRKLQRLRYRDGKIEDYSSRLHYVSDWMYENQNRIKNISKDLGGRLETKKINFMSTHLSSYPRLQNNSGLQNKIKKYESELNERGGYYVVDKKMISKYQDKIQDGDIIVFSTTISGLDFSHIGIAYRDGKRLTFIHASSAAKKVIVESKSLLDYCKRSSKCDGIVVLRMYKD